MGLDMYAHKTRAVFTSPVEFPERRDGTEDVEFHYWRKHPNLHGWMRDLYYRKRGQPKPGDGGHDTYMGEEFNSVPVVLTSEDLDALEKCIRDGTLPYTTGFFFGETRGTEEEDDLLFIREAREAIADGYTVYYTSWW